MQFHYIASRADNKIVEGDLEAERSADVLGALASKGLRPISIKSAQTLQTKRSFLGGGVTVTDQVFLTKYLALMLQVGTNLFSAIDILIADFDKPSVKALLLEMKSNLEKGKPFYITFVNYPKIFSPVFVNMIKAGEASGKLEKVFADLSVSLEKEMSLRQRVKGAFIYPVVLMSASLAILVLLVTFALPKIADVFSSTGFKPPLFSRVVFVIGLFIGNNLWWLLGGAVVLVVSFMILFTRNLIFRRVVSKFFKGLPLIKDVVNKLGIQRFASTLSSLMKAGLPIIDALEITAEASGNDEIKNALLRISREGIAQGLTIGEAFKREPAFPKAVTNLVAISEKSGHVDEILNTLAVFYEGEIDSSLKTLVSLMEPILLIVIGLVIAVIALSIIVPIYQLVGSF